MNIDKNYKIKNLTPELSKQVQEICIAHGFLNALGEAELERCNLDFFLVQPHKHIEGMFVSFTTSWWNKHGATEISPRDFIAKFGQTKAL